MVFNRFMDLEKRDGRGVNHVGKTGENWIQLSERVLVFEILVLVFLLRVAKNPLPITKTQELSASLLQMSRN